jgi:predicted extracellular nuclease
VATFRFSPGGPPLTIFALKLKSKRMEPAFPNLNPVQDRFTERQRKMQAKVVRHYINEILAKDPNALVMGSGDCGDFPFPEPGEGVDALSILAGQGDELPMENLVRLAEEGTSYTMIFHGNGITLSHMLVSPALRKQFVHIDMLHFNATMPHRYGTVPDTGLRATDRDPFEASFDLRPKKK